MQTTIMRINGMTCMGCVNSIKSVLEKISGVSSVDISLESNQAKIHHDSERTNITQFKEAIEEAGFEVNI